MSHRHPNSSEPVLNRLQKNRSKRIRVLVIGQDNLFENLPWVESHHVVTRPSYTPDTDFDPTHFKSLWSSLLNLYRGHYHLAVFPAVDLEWTANARPFQKYARAILRHLVKLRLSHVLFKALVPKATHLAVLDRYDAPTIHETAANLFHANSYWKVNTPIPSPSSQHYPIHYIPMWIFPPKQGWQPVPWEQKDIDVFAAFSLNAPQRVRALQWLRQFAKDYPQYRIIIPEQMLSAEDFQNHLNRTRLCLSPEGIGFHCFRHYQCMPCGAIPFITRNPSVFTDLVDQENCFLYDDHEKGFRSSLLQALQNPSLQATIAHNALQQFHQHHTPEAVALFMLEHTLPDLTPGPEES